MFPKPIQIALLAVLTVASFCVPLLGADKSDPPEAAPFHNAGFFERNYVLTEIIVVPIFALLIAAAMASDTTMQRIETQHFDFWKQPKGRSYTYVPVPQVPSSPREIKNTLIVVGVIYIILRLTCLSGCFSSIFQLIGSLIDIFLR